MLHGNYNYSLSITALLITVVLLGGIFYIFFFPTKEVDYLNVPFPVEHKVYHAGDVVPINIELIKYTDSLYTVTGSLQGKTYVYDLGTRNRAIPKGDSKFTSLIWQIPDKVKSDTYRMQFVAHIPINGLREESIVSSTEWFEVIGNE